MQVKGVQTKLDPIEIHYVEKKKKNLQLNDDNVVISCMNCPFNGNVIFRSWRSNFAYQ